MINSDAGTSKRYEYDGQDRLVKFVLGAEVSTYPYDAQGRRLGRKTINRTSGADDAVYFQYDGIQAIVERDGAGAASALVTRGTGDLTVTARQDGTISVSGAHGLFPAFAIWVRTPGMSPQLIHEYVPGPTQTVMDLWDYPWTTGGIPVYR